MWNKFYELVTSSQSNHTPPLPLSSSYYVIVETMGADQEKDSVLFEKLLERALESNIIHLSPVQSNSLDVKFLICLLYTSPSPRDS